MRRTPWLALAGAACLALCACGARSASSPAPRALALERTIPLAQVSGRIDHLAIDPPRRRLFIAELGNSSVEALDLATGRSLGRLGGLSEPQGLGYLPKRDELVVATGGDGMLRFYRAADLGLVGALKLGEDADDVRVDPQSGRVIAGFGKALAIVDPARRTVVRSIPLGAHPEGFQVRGERAFVNLPQARAIAALDLAQGREIARWRNPGPQMNFPMALNAADDLAAVVYRFPARLVLFDPSTGKVVQQAGVCGDADDVDFDEARKRLYVICGSGMVEVFARSGQAYASADRVSTRNGARTGLYEASLDRLYVAARARGAEPAAIMVYRPSSS